MLCVKRDINFVMTYCDWFKKRLTHNIQVVFINQQNQFFAQLNSLMAILIPGDYLEYVALPQ
jgi:hypothetical protein